MAEPIAKPANLPKSKDFDPGIPDYVMIEARFPGVSNSDSRFPHVTSKKKEKSGRMDFVLRVVYEVAKLISLVIVLGWIVCLFFAPCGRDSYRSAVKLQRRFDEVQGNMKKIESVLSGIRSDIDGNLLKKNIDLRNTIVNTGQKLKIDKEENVKFHDERQLEIERRFLSFLISGNERQEQLKQTDVDQLPAGVDDGDANKNMSFLSLILVKLRNFSQSWPIDINKDEKNIGNNAGQMCKCDPNDNKCVHRKPIFQDNEMVLAGNTEANEAFTTTSAPISTSGQRQDRKPKMRKKRKIINDDSVVNGKFNANLELPKLGLFSKLGVSLEDTLKADSFKGLKSDENRFKMKVDGNSQFSAGMDMAANLDIKPEDYLPSIGGSFVLQDNVFDNANFGLAASQKQNLSNNNIVAAVAVDKHAGAAVIAVDKNAGAASIAADKKAGAASIAVDKKAGAASIAADKHKDVAALAVDKQTGAAALAMDKHEGATATAGDKHTDSVSIAVDKNQGAEAKNTGESVIAMDRHTYSASIEMDKNQGAEARTMEKHKSATVEAVDKNAATTIAVDKHEGAAALAMDKQAGAEGLTVDKHEGGTAISVDKHADSTIISVDKNQVADTKAVDKNQVAHVKEVDKNKGTAVAALDKNAAAAIAADKYEGVAALAVDKQAGTAALAVNKYEGSTATVDKHVDSAILAANKNEDVAAEAVDQYKGVVAAAVDKNAGTLDSLHTFTRNIDREMNSDFNKKVDLVLVETSKSDIEMNEGHKNSHNYKPILDLSSNLSKHLSANVEGNNKFSFNQRLDKESSSNVDFQKNMKSSSGSIVESSYSDARKQNENKSGSNLSFEGSKNIGSYIDTSIVEIGNPTNNVNLFGLNQMLKDEKGINVNYNSAIGKEQLIENPVLIKQETKTESSILEQKSKIGSLANLRFRIGRSAPIIAEQNNLNESSPPATDQEKSKIGALATTTSKQKSQTEGSPHITTEQKPITESSLQITTDQKSKTESSPQITTKHDSKTERSSSKTVEETHTTESAISTSIKKETKFESPKLETTELRSITKSFPITDDSVSTASSMPLVTSDNSLGAGLKKKPKADALKFKDFDQVLGVEPEQGNKKINSFGNIIQGNVSLSSPAVDSPGLNETTKNLSTYNSFSISDAEPNLSKNRKLKDKTGMILEINDMKIEMLPRVEQTKSFNDTFIAARNETLFEHMSGESAVNNGDAVLFDDHIHTNITVDDDAAHILSDASKSNEYKDFRSKETDKKNNAYQQIMSSDKGIVVAVIETLPEQMSRDPVSGSIGSMLFGDRIPHVDTNITVDDDAVHISSDASKSSEGGELRGKESKKESNNFQHTKDSDKILVGVVNETFPQQMPMYSAADSVDATLFDDRFHNFDTNITVDDDAAHILSDASKSNEDREFRGKKADKENNKFQQTKTSDKSVVGAVIEILPEQMSRDSASGSMGDMLLGDRIPPFDTNITVDDDAVHISSDASKSNEGGELRGKETDKENNKFQHTIPSDNTLIGVVNETLSEQMSSYSTADSIGDMFLKDRISHFDTNITIDDDAVHISSDASKFDKGSEFNGKKNDEEINKLQHIKLYNESVKGSVNDTSEQMSWDSPVNNMWDMSVGKKNLDFDLNINSNYDEAYNLSDASNRTDIRVMNEEDKRFSSGNADSVIAFPLYDSPNITTTLTESEFEDLSKFLWMEDFPVDTSNDAGSLNDKSNWNLKYSDANFATEESVSEGAITVHGAINSEKSSNVSLMNQIFIEGDNVQELSVIKSQSEASDLSLNLLSDISNNTSGLGVTLSSNKISKNNSSLGRQMASEASNSSDQRQTVIVSSDNQNYSGGDSSSNVKTGPLVHNIRFSSNISLSSDNKNAQLSVTNLSIKIEHTDNNETLFEFNPNDLTKNMINRSIDTTSLELHHPVRRDVNTNNTADGNGNSLKEVNSSSTIEKTNDITAVKTDRNATENINTNSAEKIEKNTASYIDSNNTEEAGGDKSEEIENSTAEDGIAEEIDSNSAEEIDSNTAEEIDNNTAEEMNSVATEEIDNKLVKQNDNNTAENINGNIAEKRDRNTTEKPESNTETLNPLGNQTFEETLERIAFLYNRDKGTLQSNVTDL